MSNTTEATPHILYSPDNRLLGDFIESSPWLLHHDSLLENLKSNYQKGSPLFQNLAREFGELNLEMYSYSSKDLEAGAVSDLSERGEVSHEAVETVEASADIEHSIIEQVSQAPEKREERFDTEVLYNMSNFQNIIKDIKSTKKQRSAGIETQHVSKAKEPDGSNDIMKTEGGRSIDIARFKPNDALLRASLRKPPETSISKIKVSTKVTNLIDTEYQPIDSGPKKMSLKRFINGSVSKKTRKPNTNPQKTIPDPGKMVSEASKSRGVPGGPGGPGTQDEDVSGTEHPSSFENQGNSESIEVVSKKSVVSRNLPLYIREQIQLYERKINGKFNYLPDDDSNRNVVTKSISPTEKRNSKLAGSGRNSIKFKSSDSAINAQSVSGSTAMTPRGRIMEQRINNLLENSLSLYHQSESNRYDSDTGHASIMESGHNESGISDADKEYVSAYLFARSLEDFDENITYENLDSELQGDESFRTVRSGLDGHNNETEYDDNIVDGGSQEMRLFTQRD